VQSPIFNGKFLFNTILIELEMGTALKNSLWNCGIGRLHRVTSVAKGEKFRPQSTKMVITYLVVPDNFGAEFLTDLSKKRAEMGPNFLKFSFFFNTKYQDFLKIITWVLINFYLRFCIANH
jgi:hypothetical protein